jgi:hypothetical protein
MPKLTKKKTAKKTSRKVARDAGSGEFVTLTEAKKRPKSTVVETVKNSKR